MQNSKRDMAIKVIEEKIKTFSRVEKAFYGSVVCSALLLAIGIIFMQTRLLQIQSDMANIHQKINEKQVEIDDAKQAANELVRHARLMELAEKAGLTFNNDNIGVAE